MLRTIPYRGRLLMLENDRPGAPSVVVISYRLWQQRFGGDEQIVGRTLRANATATTVVGVLPPDFQFMGSDVDCGVLCD